MDILHVVGRQSPLFVEDLTSLEQELSDRVNNSRFLVIGGAGSIGQAVTIEVFRRNPRLLHVVDLSENTLVELVRDIRSSLGYIDGEFRTFAIDCGSKEFEALVSAGTGYDYVLNLSALKHVRSERDPFTLMRLIEVNILNALAVFDHAGRSGATKYFCVSTDKAANPANMMGASKRLMEMFLMDKGSHLPISMARFANVAFSNGSLLDGFTRRVAKHQPLSAPIDVRRYFVTPQESGQLCLMSALLGEHRDIFFPKLTAELHLERFSEIAKRYLQQLGYEPVVCASEDEARGRAASLIPAGKWPCYFFESDTTGEKPAEEFYMEHEELDMARFNDIGVVRTPAHGNLPVAGDEFVSRINQIRNSGAWEKEDLVTLFLEALPSFEHVERGKSLDQRM